MYTLLTMPVPIQMVLMIGKLHFIIHSITSALALPMVCPGGDMKQIKSSEKSSMTLSSHVLKATKNWRLFDIFCVFV